MSQFNRDYLNWYGVYVLQSVDSGDSVFRSMTEELDEASFQYELTGHFSNSDLASCISDYMRLRGFAFEGEKMLERLGCSISDLTGDPNLSGKGVSTFLPTFKKYLKNQEKWESIFKTLKEVGTLVGLEDKLEDFFDFVDELMLAWEENSSATLQIGDSSVLVSLFDPSCIGELTKAFDAYMDADLPGIVDRLLMNEYASFQFDSRLTGYKTAEGEDPDHNMLGISFTDIHGTNQCDIEYLMCGTNSSFLNNLGSSQIIFGMRLILDMSAYMMDSSKKELALGIAEILSIVIAVISAGTIVIEPSVLKYFVLFVMAYVRALSDMFNLISGKEVPMFYNKKITEGLGEFAQTKYRDYFRIMLLFVPQDTLLTRMRTIIERDCGSDLYTGVSATGTLGSGYYEVKRRYELYENH